MLWNERSTGRKNMPFNIGGPEMIIILVIILIIFGVGRLPEVGGAIGRGLKEFRKSQSGSAEDIPKPQAETSTEEKRS